MTHFPDQRLFSARSSRHLLPPAGIAATLLLAPSARAQWNGYAGNPQHTALSSVASLPLDRIRWSTPVDDNPPEGTIYIHYGSPVITAANTVIVPVRAVNGGYRLEARRGSDGSLIWETMSDYVTTPSTGGWVPSYTPALTPSGALYYQGIGGTVWRVDDPNSGTVTPVQMSFLPDYAAQKAAYDSSVFISTPITSDSAGTIYFGYETIPGAPGGLQSGIARIAANGAATYTSANAASGVDGAGDLRVGTNSAPALSNDGSTLYAALHGSGNYLAAIDAVSLAPLHHTPLNGEIHDASTASPTIGPDGHVYFGVLWGYHYRGTLQHFSADLSQTFTPGSFGWDNTVSIVPASMVPSYLGTSSYLVMAKYNDYYYDGGGTGINKVAVLDPNATQFDPLANQDVMREVLTIAGVTPDPELPRVREWCINTAAVDPQTNSILVNCEDGILYRWDVTTNTFTQRVALQATGTAEAYTPTLIGPDGTVYAINKATLSAVGTLPPACLADFNQDGGIDGADVNDFFQAWEGGDASADVNADGGIDGSDVSTFFDHWEAGC